MRKDLESNDEIDDKELSSLAARRSDNLQQWRRNILITFFVSLVVHITLLFALPYLLPKESKNNKMALQVWLSDPPPQEHEQLQNDDQKRPVVALAPPFDVKKPDKANYWADYDQRTNNEQKARNPRIDDELNNGKNQKINADIENRENHDFAKTLNENGLHKRSKGSKKQKNSHDPLGILLKFDGTGTSSPSTDDFLPNVKEGDHTELNAWQWRHATFFNRIKSRIAHLWSPQTQIDRYDPQGVLLGQQDHVTVMLVTIDRFGALKDLTVTNYSGIAYLDEEAERAFKAAAPFLYPPKELFNGKEQFSFTFAFHLHVSKGFSFDLDWKND